jgi:uncharacterized CHY-type Zn-finger protein
VVCGKCGYLMGIGEYIGCGNMCGNCGGGFNPGCKGHWGVYFEV